MSFFSAILGQAGPRAKDVKVGELEALPEGTRIIDVRQPEEFNGELSHLDGAELVPLGTLQSAASDWDREAPVLMVCRSGGRSGQACQALLRMGFSNVMNLRGGMMAVRAAR